MVFDPKQNLSSGMSGIHITELQQFLLAQGYKVTATGRFDSATLSAVKKFQTANGLVADGIVGPKTTAVVVAKESAVASPPAQTTPTQTAPAETAPAETAPVSTPLPEPEPAPAPVVTPTPTPTPDPWTRPAPTEPFTPVDPGGTILPPATPPEEIAPPLGGSPWPKPPTVIPPPVETAPAGPPPVAPVVQPPPVVTPIPGPIAGPPVTAAKIPAGAQLLRIYNPTGSDEPILYFLKYTINGVPITYEIGGTARFAELFPQGMGTPEFALAPGYIDASGAWLDQQDFHQVGSVDEILGSDESLASVFEREMQSALSGGTLADWVARDPNALAIMVIGTQEGWSKDKINKELSGTAAFKARFSGFDAFVNKTYAGTPNITTALDEYVKQEQQLTTAIRYYRGGNANTSTAYLGELIGSGWSPEQITQLLPIEQQLRDNPNTLADFNRIMTFMGKGAVGVQDFVKAATGNAPLDMTEALSDFNLLTALQEQGLGFTPEQIAQVRTSQGTDMGTVQEVAAFRDVSRSIAMAVIQNRHELDAEKYGVDRDSLLAAAFNRPDLLPEGKAPADVESMLSKFLRERQAASQGYEGVAGYQTAEGRLRVQGLAGL